MKRRAFLRALSGSLLAAPLAAEAQPALEGTVQDKLFPLLLVMFVFAAVVVFGLLMLVFRQDGRLKSGSPETGPAGGCRGVPA